MNRKIHLFSKSLFEQIQIFLVWHLGYTKSLKVLCLELNVEKLKSSLLQPIHQMQQCDLGCARNQGEHAFPGKHSSQRNPIKSSNESVVDPDFDGMSNPDLM